MTPVEQAEANVDAGREFLTDLRAFTEVVEQQLAQELAWYNQAVMEAPSC